MTDLVWGKNLTTCRRKMCWRENFHLSFSPIDKTEARSYTINRYRIMWRYIYRKIVQSTRMPYNLIDQYDFGVKDQRGTPSWLQMASLEFWYRVLFDLLSFLISYTCICINCLYHGYNWSKFNFGAFLTWKTEALH